MASKQIAMPKEFKNRWMVPGDEKYTDIPVIASSRQNRNDTNLSYAYNAYNYSTADKKLNGQDPEFTNAGGVAIPMPKQFTCTLRLGL